MAAPDDRYAQTSLRAHFNHLPFYPPYIPNFPMPPTSSAVYSSSQYYQPNSFLHLQHTPGKDLVCVDFQKRKQVEIAKKNTDSQHYDIYMYEWFLKISKGYLVVDGIKRDCAARWHSGRIAKVMPPDLLETKSGSVYRLMGPPNSFMQEALNISDKTLDLFANGLPKNWANIILTDTSDSIVVNSLRQFSCVEPVSSSPLFVTPITYKSIIKEQSMVSPFDQNSKVDTPVDSKSSIKKCNSKVDTPVDSKSSIKKCNSKVVTPVDSKSSVGKRILKVDTPVDSKSSIKKCNSKVDTPVDSKSSIKKCNSKVVTSVDSKSSVGKRILKVDTPVDSKSSIKKCNSKVVTFADSKSSIKKSNSKVDTPVDSKSSVGKCNSKVDTPVDSKSSVGKRILKVDTPVDSKSSTCIKKCNSKVVTFADSKSSFNTPVNRKSSSLHTQLPDSSMTSKSFLSSLKHSSRGRLLKPVLSNFTKGFCTYSYNGRGELQGLSSPVIDLTDDIDKNTCTTRSKRVKKEIKSEKESNDHNMSLAGSKKKKRIRTNFSSDEEDTTPKRRLRNRDIKSYNGRGELQGLSSPVIDSTGDATKNTTCSKRVEKEIKSQKESNNHNMSLAESNKKKRILTNFSSDEEETTPNRKLRNSDIKSLSYNGRGELQGLSSPVIDLTDDTDKNTCTTCSKRVEKEIKSKKESNDHNMSLAESNKKRRIRTNFSSDEEDTTPNRKLRNRDIKRDPISGRYLKLELGKMSPKHQRPHPLSNSCCKKTSPRGAMSQTNLRNVKTNEKIMFKVFDDTSDSEEGSIDSSDIEEQYQRIMDSIC